MRVGVGRVGRDEVRLQPRNVPGERPGPAQGPAERYGIKRDSSLPKDRHEQRIGRENDVRAGISTQEVEHLCLPAPPFSGGIDMQYAHSFARSD
jgi:hypothetical protein